jgi:hypothetical protein
MHACKVEQKMKQDNRLLFVVEDPLHFLYALDNSFRISWAGFDIYSAIKHYKTENRSWDDFKNLTWDDLKNHSWTDFTISGGVLPGFRINDIAPGGKIR